MARVRTRPSREETIEQLLRGAAEAFAEFGVHGAALEDICSRADLTRGAFYSSFRSKEELALALHSRLTDDLIEKFAQALDGLPPATNPQEFIAALLARLQFDRQVHVLVTEFHLLALRNADFGDQMALQNRRLFSAMGAAATEAAGRSGFGFTVDADLLSRSLGALFFHGQLQSLLDPGVLKPGDLVQAVTPFLIAPAGQTTGDEDRGAFEPARLNRPLRTDM
jgi:AcrR family transcriptional regulator